MIVQSIGNVSPGDKEPGLLNHIESDQPPEERAMTDPFDPPDF